MPWVGFEPMIPVFEQAKTFHALGQCGPLWSATYTVVVEKEFISCEQSDIWQVLMVYKRC
jgi:hypothetical protein